MAGAATIQVCPRRVGGRYNPARTGSGSPPPLLPRSKRRSTQVLFGSVISIAMLARGPLSRAPFFLRAGAAGDGEVP